MARLVVIGHAYLSPPLRHLPATFPPHKSHPSRYTDPEAWPEVAPSYHRRSWASGRVRLSSRSMKVVRRPVVALKVSWMRLLVMTASLAACRGGRGGGRFGARQDESQAMRMQYLQEAAEKIKELTGRLWLVPM